MNREKRAIEILNNELQHNKIHLQEKGKAPEYYQELGDICEALELAIKALEEKDRNNEMLSKGFVMGWSRSWD